MNKALKWLRCSKNLLSVLDVSVNTELSTLNCNENQLTVLDVSANTELKWLDCFCNQLTDLNVSMNKKLYYLDCFENRITELDVSANTELSSLLCAGNQLTSLNISANDALSNLYCFDNQLTSLDVRENSVFGTFACYNNSLALSKLFKISENIIYEDFSSSPIEVIRERYFGPQFLPLQTVSIGDEIDYSDQNIFKGIPTQFDITKNGIPATQSDYSIVDGKIVFARFGNYMLTMTNEAIISASYYPAKVIVEIKVGEVGNEQVLQNATKIKAYPNPTSGQLIIVHRLLKTDSYSIYNVTGQMVMQGKLQEETTAINVHTLSSGIYYLRISDEVVKFIKQ
jgi:Leucine-rich repeat (LRR) protein